MYSTARTAARPPQQVRAPRRVPLSRFSGATPTKAAILLAIQRAQLWQVRQQGPAQHGPYPRHALQQIILGSPQGTLLEVLAQLLIQLFQARLQPGDVRCNVGLDRGGGLPTSIRFGREP